MPRKRPTRLPQGLEANLYGRAGLGLSHALSGQGAARQLFDDGECELIPTPEAPLDPLKFRDIKRYTDG